MTTVSRNLIEGSSTPRAYRIHAWKDPELEARMIRGGFVSLGGDELGDLSAISTAKEVGDLLKVAMPERSPAAIRIFVGYWRRFLFEAADGDIVVVPTKSMGVAVGLFSSGYFYVASAHPRARHRRQVRWQSVISDRSNLPESIDKVLSGRHSLQQITSVADIEFLAQHAGTFQESAGLTDSVVDVMGDTDGP